MIAALLFDNFGPYHLARLRGAADVLGPSGVMGLQMRQRSAEYGWRASGTDMASVELRTILPSGAEDANSMRRVSAVWRQLQELRPGAVAIAGYAAPEMLAALGWCLRGRRVAVLLSESKADDTARALWGEQVKGMVVRRYDAAVVGGGPQRRYLEELGFPSDGIFTGYDVVDNTYFARSAEEVRRKKEELRRKHQLPENYFLASARFIEKKNLFGLIRAYAAYREHLSLVTDHSAPWHLVLLGDGPLRDSLNSQLSTLNLRSYVHLPGFKQYDELPIYYALAKAFIHASATEQWGLVVNEAMATGCPVFVSRTCGCFEDLIQEGKTGFGFDPFHCKGLASLMLRATRGELPLETLGSAARTHIANFSPLHFGRALQSALEYASQRCGAETARS